MAVNRTVKIAGAVVGLVAVYFGLVFVSGALSEGAARQIEAQGSFDVGTRRAVKVEKISYERGFFHSVATGTYVLSGAAQLTADKKPITFQMRHLITHGPVTRSGLGWARTENELILDPATAAQIAKYLGDKKPLEMVVRHGFLGGIKGRLASPAFSVEEEGTKYQWGGVEGRFSLGRGGSSFSGDFLLPSLSIADGEGRLDSKNITFKADLRRVFDVLYEGTANAEVGEFTFAKTGEEPLKVQKLGYAFDLDRKGDFLDAKVRIGSGNIEVQGFKLQKARYDFTVKHVHAPTYATYAKDLQALTEKFDASSEEDALNMAPEVMSSTEGLFLKLLEKDPELIIDRIGITAAAGEFGISGTLKIVGFKPEDLQLGPMGAMSKLQADLQVFLDEPLLDIELPESKADPEDDVDPGMADADEDPLLDESGEGAAEPSAPLDRSKLHAQVAAMEKAGFLVRKGNRVESRLEIKDGQITANGKPVAGGPM